MRTSILPASVTLLVCLLMSGCAVEAACAVDGSCVYERPQQSAQHTIPAMGAFMSAMCTLPMRLAVTFTPFGIAQTADAETPACPWVGGAQSC